MPQRAEPRLRVRFSACQLDAWVAERLRSGVERVSSPVGSAVFVLQALFVRRISIATSFSAPPLASRISRKSPQQD
jgi:hypothetical protein